MITVNYENSTLLIGFEIEDKDIGFSIHKLNGNF